MATKYHDLCLDKVADDEPIFVLRAQDITAPDVVRFWIRNALDQGAHIDPEKLTHAWACIDAMEAWPMRKLPD